MSYQSLCRINRALDAYNWPETFPPIKCIQALRVLFDNTKKFPGLPTQEEIHSRFFNLASMILIENDRQTINELMDTALHLGVPRIDRRTWTEEQKIAFDAIENLRHPEHQRSNESKEKDVFSLKSISHDSQNVHHSQISDNIKKIAVQICKDYPSSSYWKWSEYIAVLRSRKSWSVRCEKSLDFIRDTDVTFGIGVILRDIFSSLCTWIQLHPNREDLLDRLNEELCDMSGTCSTGHLSRLINVPQGFTERYKLSIVPSEEIKSFIHRDLSFGLSVASEEIQEGIIGDKTPAFQDWVAERERKYTKKFGTMHGIYIQKVITDYFEPK